MGQERKRMNRSHFFARGVGEGEGDERMTGMEDRRRLSRAPQAIENLSAVLMCLRSV